MFSWTYHVLQDDPEDPLNSTMTKSSTGSEHPIQSALIEILLICLITIMNLAMFFSFDRWRAYNFSFNASTQDRAASKSTCRLTSRPSVFCSSLARQPTNIPTAIWWVAREEPILEEELTPRSFRKPMSVGGTHPTSIHKAWALAESLLTLGLRKERSPRRPLLHADTIVIQESRGNCGTRTSYPLKSSHVDYQCRIWSNIQ